MAQTARFSALHGALALAGVAVAVAAAVAWWPEPPTPEQPTATARPTQTPATATAAAPPGPEVPIAPRQPGDFPPGEFTRLGVATAQVWPAVRARTPWLLVDAPPSPPGEVVHLRELAKAVWVRRDVGAVVALAPPQDPGDARNHARATLDALQARPDGTHRRTVVVAFGVRCRDALQLVTDDRVQAVALVDPPADVTTAVAQDPTWTVHASRKFALVAGPAAAETAVRAIADRFAHAKAMAQGEAAGVSWLGESGHRAAVLGWLGSVLGP